MVQSPSQWLSTSGVLVGALLTTMVQESTASTLPWFDPSLPTKQRAAALVASLSIEDKVSQLVTDAKSLPDQGLPSYHWRNNVLHGLVDNGVSTQFPQATGLAATWDADLLYNIGAVCAIEQRAKHNIATGFNDLNNSVMDYGLDLWGPNINMFRDSRWGRGQETYGECPTLSGILGASFITGLQSSDVPGILKTIATAKHFDAYSLDRMPPRLSFDPNISQADLQQYYFPAFRDVVKAGVRSIMCSYNGINGYPMCMSPLLQSVLRDELGFGGYIVTDSGALDFMVSMFKRFNSSTDSAAAAMNAGVDLNSGDVYLRLLDALNESKVSETQIDQALQRVMEARIDVGLMNPRETLGDMGKYDQKDILSPQHRLLAVEAAKKSLTLLRNEDDLLPLKLKKGSKIAVIGPAANDTFRLMGNYYGCSFGTWGPVLANCSVSTPLQGITNLATTLGFNVGYTEGCAQEDTNTSGFPAAKSLAESSDLVIAMLGLRNCEGGQGRGGPNCESEGHDRDELGLPGMQLQLLQLLVATGKDVALVITNGGPVSLPWASQNVKAIMYSWYGGIAAGEALADVLFAINGSAPSGRLPFTVLQSVNDLPPETDMSLTASPYGRTYRYLNGKDPQYNFGYGLSYTTFVYSKLSLSTKTASRSTETIKACFVLTNSGSRSSEEVIEIYASLDSSSAKGLTHIPKVQLLAFNRTVPLEPNEQLDVCMSLELPRLALLGIDNTVAVQPGSYTVYVGGSAPGVLGVNVQRSAVPEPITATLILT